MFKKIIAVLFVLLLAAPAVAGACTTIIVGRNATDDGSLIYGRTADGEEFETTLIVTMPAKTLPAPWDLCKHP